VATSAYLVHYMTSLVPSKRGRKNSSWQLKLLAVLPAIKIIIEEIGIKQCLNKSGDPSYPMNIVWLSEVAINPVENVECPISTKKKYVLPGQVVNIPSPL